MSTRDERITIHNWDGAAVLDLGPIEIWDGADLALLRDTMLHLIRRQKCRSIGISMRSVKYIPSGFFGMLYDWHDKGISIRLYQPQPKVQMMLWFRQFCEHVADGCFLMHSEPKKEMRLPDNARWDDAEIWEAETAPEAETHSLHVDDNEWLPV